ncbi:hypothetical protein BKA70DRAFT_1420007 [Coprinopsis sp. MPI-PUGE-AT-0042]|nr:hypothetical protein BKA70DRAFT_1420007 [Coprinopsis sp. MPI-PUGE-AT-0042]
MSPGAEATGVRRRSPKVDRRQETSSVSLDPVASSTDSFPVPSSSDIISSSVEVISSSSSGIPSTSAPSSFSQSPSPPTSTTVPFSTQSTSFTSFTSASSESVTLLESSSIAELSSSSAVISSFSVSTSSTAFNPSQPATTLVIANSVVPTSTRVQGVETTSVAPSETSNPAAAGAASTGFWGNKAAVAATFTVVSLIAAGLLVVAVIAFLKRRNNARQRQIDDELYGDPSFIDNHGDQHSSPSGSMRERPLDPFTSNDVVYTGYGFQDSSVGIPYPDTRNVYDATVRPYQEQAGYIPATNPQLSDTSHSSGHNTYWTPNASQAAVKASTKQYMLPSQSQAQAAANFHAPSNAYSSSIPSMAPVPTKAEPVRASLDSFYGYKGSQQARY